MFPLFLRQAIPVINNAAVCMVCLLACFFEFPGILIKVIITMATLSLIDVESLFDPVERFFNTTIHSFK